MTTTPEPVEIHRDRTTAAKASQAGRTGLLGGAGVFVACALVCCFPLLAAGVAAIGLGTVATGAWAIGHTPRRRTPGSQEARWTARSPRRVETRRR